MKKIFTFCSLLFAATAFAQNVGINVVSPAENLHVDSTIKVGKNTSISTSTPGRKNLLKFGDANYVTIGEEVGDDKMYMRYGDLILLKSSGSAGSGFLGINTETPSAQMDINGTFRIRGNGAAAGNVLTSDANGNATWQLPSTLVRDDVYSVGSLDFKAVISSDPVNNGNGNGGAYYINSITARLQSPIHLPNGVKVTQITYGFYDNTAQDFYFEFGTEYTTQSGYGQSYAVSSSGASASWRTVTYTPASPIIINNNTFSYYVSAYTSWPGNSNMAIKSVIFQYTY